MKMKQTLVWAVLSATVLSHVAVAQDDAQHGLVRALPSAEVPYAVRVDSMLRFLAASAARSDGSTASYLLNHGIAANEPAGEQLVALAQWLAAAHPIEVPEKIREAYADDDAGFLAWQRDRDARRAEAAGAGFGAWLRDRQAAGYPLDPLVDRLLNSEFMTVSMYSDEPQEHFDLVLADRCDRFERAMQQSIGHLPIAFVRDGGM